MFKTAKYAKKTPYKEFDFQVVILDFSKGVNPWFWVKIEKLTLWLHFF